MTDEQIIAAAGEPVAHVVKDDEGEQLMYPAAIFKYKMASEDDIIYDLYTADAILAAAKPLRERISELEAKVGRLKALCSKMDGQLGKRPCQNERCVTHNELTKQRDGLLVSLNRIVADSDGTCLASVRHLARIAAKAIAKVKDAA